MSQLLAPSRQMTAIARPIVETAVEPITCPPGRVAVCGKFFLLDHQRWYLKGLTYGPFARNSDGDFLPPREVLVGDLERIAELGANSIRLYHAPPRWLLDEALERGLRVMVDVPWDKHRCFFEEWSAQQQARLSVRRVARELGDHPAVLAISVANELPADITRFYGRQRVGRFVDELLDEVKQQAPQCLATFASFPSTEFLSAARRDFYCFNVYLDDATALRAYLDRLQHLAGGLPLVLGEYGVDSIRHGEAEQATMLQQHVTAVFQHGLAGSFVFSYTDEWFTGGHDIDDWAFGVTRKDRASKPAAALLSSAWQRVPHLETQKLPRVSVVVCSYNGAATLRQCLSSLEKLDYPDYEVILVDDGSTDTTAQIAADFPSIRYIGQENRGLSEARNVGAAAATGEIVAYTDSDCIAEREWLLYLVEAMQRQGVAAIGGPNLPPAAEGWVARCVAVSPGAPSHVMLDDHRAEHVPGCNMAFERKTLLELGGFDPQFRVAGDDVDICWRLLDSGKEIGFAPSAVVWHHRRQSVQGYLKQQRGYGRNEGALYYKHLRRFNRLGCSRWNGIIYGDGAPLQGGDCKTYHGVYGSGLFQAIYARNDHSVWDYFTLLEWHALALFVLLLAAIYPPLAIVSGAMWAATLVSALRRSLRCALPQASPWWCRPLVLVLHVVQPIIRASSRYRYRLARKRIPDPAGYDTEAAQLKRICWRQRDAYWSSKKALGREHLLGALVAMAKQAGWEGVFHEEWEPWDLLLFCDKWHNLRVLTATEELGWPERFTRARATICLTVLAKGVLSGLCLAEGVALASGNYPAAAVVGVVLLGMGLALLLSRSRCFAALGLLLGRAGEQAGLETLGARPQRKAVHVVSARIAPEAAEAKMLSA